MFKFVYTSIDMNVQSKPKVVGSVLPTGAKGKSFIWLMRKKSKNADWLSLK